MNPTRTSETILSKIVQNGAVIILVACMGFVFNELWETSKFKSESSGIYSEVKRNTALIDKLLSNEHAKAEEMDRIRAIIMQTKDLILSEVSKSRAGLVTQDTLDKHTMQVSEARGRTEQLVEDTNQRIIKLEQKVSELAEQINKLREIPKKP